MIEIESCEYLMPVCATALASVSMASEFAFRLPELALPLVFLLSILTSHRLLKLAVRPLKHYSPLPLKLPISLRHQQTPVQQQQ
jgi:hypothetical protein